MAKHNKLLLVGGTNGSVHVQNYYNLIEDQWNDILIITDRSIDFCPCVVVDFSLKNPLKVLQSIARIKKEIQSFNPDVIHVHQANSFAFMTARANTFNIPMILTTWGSDVLVMPKRGPLFKYIVKYALKKADVITADAKFMIEAINDLGIDKEVVLANFGIEYDDIHIPEKEKIIYSNRLHGSLYNIDKIILAFTYFFKDHTDWKLVIGAHGPLTDSLKNLAKQHLPDHAYEFIGFVDKDENKRQYLRAKIWASIPSSDGTAISLLEAMGYGCIPVVSDLPANHEWVADGENGVIVKGSLEEAFQRALTLDTAALIANNVQIIQKNATKKLSKKIFTNIYKSLEKL
jgi:glycosyltransferase involved in cell wall biosynthesis